MNTQEMKTATEYIKEAWSLYFKKENFMFFAKIMAILTIISSSLSYLTGYLYPADYLKNIDYSNIPMVVLFVAISVAAMIVGLWTQTTTYISVLRMGTVEKDILIQGYKKMFKFFLATLVIGIIVTFGAILLIIPAILFGIWYSFTLFLVLDKDIKIGEALKTSKLLVKGKFWKILGRFVVFGTLTFLVTLLLSSVQYVGNLLLSFIAPLLLLPSYLLYKDLVANN
jgi:uncharacterized membrane protein